MRVSVIGCGYLGAVHAAVMAHIGHDVVGIDVDAEKIRLLASGKPPFLEPDFDDILRSCVDAGNLRFTTDFSAARNAEAHFIGVGTPQMAGEQRADLSQLRSALNSLLPYLSPGSVVVGKSTVPVGTADSIEADIVRAGGVLVWNPEFLREGFAVADTLTPDRIVYGLSADPRRAEAGRAVLEACYEAIPASIPRLSMDYATAELVKVAANSFLATKISFINAMSQVCEATGGDVAVLAHAIGLDDRIGSKFLRAGIGFGGGCLPKDIRAFQAKARELGVGDALGFLAEIDAVNESQKIKAVGALEALLDGLKERRIAVLGATFKPNSDDTRLSPSLDVAARLAAAGASVVVTNPAANPQDLPENVAFTRDVASALSGADALFLGTEWDEYRNLDPEWAASQAAGTIVLDGRNALNPAAWKAAGWTYRGIGRS